MYSSIFVKIDKQYYQLELVMLGVKRKLLFWAVTCTANYSGKCNTAQPKAVLITIKIFTVCNMEPSFLIINSFYHVCIWWASID